MLEGLSGGRPLIGIGVDIAEVARIRRSFERHGDHFRDRVYTVAEQEYCLRQANPYPAFAARWAAKEAVAKAFGTGIGADLDLTSITVTRQPSGKPGIDLDAKGKRLLDRVGGSAVLISLSHTSETAIAFAAVVG